MSTEMNGQEHSYLKELPVVSHDATKSAKQHEVAALLGKAKFIVAEDELDAHVGSTVWPCGAYLLDAIVESPNVSAAFTGVKAAAADGAAAEFKLGATLAGKRILDLGGGTGYVAMGMCAAGAEVTSTEIDACVPLLELNTEIFNNTYRRENVGCGTMDAQALDWTKPAASKVDFAAFDVMVVCECIYAIDNLGQSPCVDVMGKFLQSGTGKRVVLAYEERDDDIEADIFEQLKAKGASATLLRKSAPVTKGESNPHPDPVHYRIVVVTSTAQ